MTGKCHRAADIHPGPHKRSYGFASLLLLHEARESGYLVFRDPSFLDCGHDGSLELVVEHVIHEVP